VLINKTNLTLFGLAAENHFRTALRMAEPASLHMKISTEIKSSGSENIYPMISSFPSIREWLGDRQVKHLKASQYRIPNKLYESTLEVRRTDLEDDNLGLYPASFATAGDAVAAHPTQLLAALLSAAFVDAKGYDEAVFFGDHEEGGQIVSNVESGTDSIATPWYLLDLSRPLKPFIFQPRTVAELQEPPDETAFKNDVYLYGIRRRCGVGFGLWQLAWGSKNELDSEAFDSAMAAMMSRSNDQGQKLGIRPTHLLCGPSRRAEGQALLETQYLSGGGSNPNYKAVELMVSPWLP
jgi:phage major head subunit gpT-like protein